MKRKVADLPESPARKILMEAERRGIEALGGIYDPRIIDETSVFILGLAALISDLQDSK